MTPKHWRIHVAKLSQLSLSRKLKCSVGHVSLIENGQRSPSLKLLRKYQQLSKGQVTPADFKIKN
ncbi:MAG: helix-turn-helix transcriptional regulator [Alphaproteobacteria bacterium]|nr:helix-turn-helix transcriptional regulator [Alphaproteobacteria bacterium]